MSDYGITPQGFNIKRLDTILEEIHADLKEAWGVDTTINDQSFLDSLIRTNAVQIARLWEQLQAVYYSQYPSTAEGIHLDNAMQFGGVTRLEDKRTIYPIACTGAEGTNVLLGTILRSTTTPAKDFQCQSLQTITKDACRNLTVKLEPADNNVYAIAINGTAYNYTAQNGESPTAIAGKLAEKIRHEAFSVDAKEDQITLTGKVPSNQYAVTISDNMTVTSVTSNLMFETVEYGNIHVPFGTITQIITNTSGLASVTNDITPVSGRIEESDVAARQSYLKRTAIRSSNIIEGISAELYELDGVTSATGTENVEDTTDANGLPPHSFEIVVNGGKDEEIAQVIFKRKAPGIRAYGTNVVGITDKFGNSMSIGFTRPTNRYIWLKVTLERNTNEPIAQNYVKLTKDAILNNSQYYGLGEKVILQSFIPYIYRALTGIQMVTIKAAVTSDASVPAGSAYTYDVVPIASREIASFDELRIEVVLSGDT